MVHPLDTVEIGNTGIRVTRLGIGGAPIGSLFRTVSDEDAVATVRRGLELGLNYIDTAPLYGHGVSETRLGRALLDIPRHSFILSTKVGRVLNPVDIAPSSPHFQSLPKMDPVFDYSRDGILRSLEESLKRLNLDRIDIAYIHDADDHWEQAIGEAYPTLADLRSQGVVQAIGVGMNQWEMEARFALAGDFDCFLLAGRYTLLDQSSLAELMPVCLERNVSLVLGGPYNSGILASDIGPRSTYDYEVAPPEITERAHKIKAVCDRHAVPLKAAALQFGLLHPAVAATIPGPRSVAEVEENFHMASHPIPTHLWAELKYEGLIDPLAPVGESQE
ncbi:MAG: aldo/keto reductase [Chloroflexota bacterium]|nr:aldo/keto reductase [Chloroflexota bacterium]